VEVEPRALPTLLFVASCLGDTRVIEALLQSRADPRCERTTNCVRFFIKAGQQPLHVAAQCGHLEAIELLIERRGSVRAVDSLGKTPLVYAAAGGFCPAVQLLLERRSALEHRTKIGSAALETAICFGKSATVQLLLAHGARPGKDGGLAALHYTGAFAGGAEVARVLIQARADLEERVRPRLGSFLWVLLAAISLPCRMGRDHLLSKVGYHAVGATPLMIAVMFDNQAEVQALLEAGADPSARNERGVDARQLADLFGSHPPSVDGPRASSPAAGPVVGDARSPPPIAGPVVDDDWGSVVSI